MLYRHFSPLYVEVYTGMISTVGFNS